MPNKPGPGRPKKLQPDGRIQATIRVEPELWNDFIIMARRHKTTATAWINQLITAAVARHGRE